jgi:hypothetical protein
MIIIFAPKKELGIASVIRALMDPTSAKYDVCSCEDAMRRTKAPPKSSVPLLRPDLQSKETGKWTGHRAPHPPSALFVNLSVERSRTRLPWRRPQQLPAHLYRHLIPLRRNLSLGADGQIGRCTRRGRRQFKPPGRYRCRLVEMTGSSLHPATLAASGRQRANGAKVHGSAFIEALLMRPEQCR